MTVLTRSRAAKQRHSLGGSPGVTPYRPRRRSTSSSKKVLDEVTNDSPVIQKSPGRTPKKRSTRNSTGGIKKKLVFASTSNINIDTNNNSHVDEEIMTPTKLTTTKTYRYVQWRNFEGSLQLTENSILFRPHPCTSPPAKRSKRLSWDSVEAVKAKTFATSGDEKHLLKIESSTVSNNGSKNEAPAVIILRFLSGPELTEVHREIVKQLEKRGKFTTIKPDPTSYYPIVRLNGSIPGSLTLDDSELVFDPLTNDDSLPCLKLSWGRVHRHHVRPGYELVLDCRRATRSIVFQLPSNDDVTRLQHDVDYRLEHYVTDSVLEEHQDADVLDHLPSILKVPSTDSHESNSTNHSNNKAVSFQSPIQEVQEALLASPQDITRELFPEKPEKSRSSSSFTTTAMANVVKIVMIFLSLVLAKVTLFSAPEPVTFDADSHLKSMVTLPPTPTVPIMATSRVQVDHDNDDVMLESLLNIPRVGRFAFVPQTKTQQFRPMIHNNNNAVAIPPPPQPAILAKATESTIQLALPKPTVHKKRSFRKVAANVGKTVHKWIQSQTNKIDSKKNEQDLLYLSLL